MMFECQAEVGEDVPTLLAAGGEGAHESGGEVAAGLAFRGEHEPAQDDGVAQLPFRRVVRGLDALHRDKGPQALELAQ